MTGPRSLRLRYARLPFLLCIMLVVVAVIGTIMVRQLERRLVASTGEGLALAAADIADKLDLFLYERYGDVQVLANTEVFRTREPAAMAAHLAKVRSAYPVYAALEVVDAGGTVIAAFDPTQIGRSRRETEWFAAVQHTGLTFVGDARTSADGHREGAAQFAVRLAGPPSEFNGAVMAAAGLPAMDALFENTVHAFQLESASHGRLDWQILTREGRALHDSLGDGTPPVNLKKLGQPAALALASERIGWIEETHSQRGVRVITGFAQTRGHREFPGLGWSVLVRLDRAKVFASMQAVLWPLALGAALVLLPLVGFIVWSTRRLHRDWAQTVASEERLITTLRSIGDGVVATDPTGRVTLMNPVAEDLTGWSEAEARGRPLDEVLRIVESETRRPLESPFDRVLREDATVAVADRRLLIARDGTERAIADSGSPIRNDAGAISGVVLVLRDVSDRELQERALRASQEMFRLITNHVSDLIAVVDLEGRQLYTSRSYGRLLGRSGSLYMTDSFADVHPDDRARMREIFSETLRTGRGQRAEYRVLREDGGTVEIESVGNVIRDARGKPDKVLVVSRDITERLQSEERLRREKEFIDTLINSLPGIFYLRGYAPQLLRWNKNMETVTGRSAEEIAQMDSIEFFREDERSLVRERAELGFTTGKADVEAFIEHADGKLAPYYITGMRLEIDGKPHLLGTGIDISARKAAEDAVREARDGLEIKVAERTRDLELANERLQELDRLKSEFLATMSHELRTPLNSIIGFTGILRQGLAGPLNEEQKKQLGMVHFSAKHLLGLINDLLDLSRIESGKMDVFLERFRIAEVVNEVVQTLTPSAAQKSLALTADLNEPEAGMVCDRKKFFQIMLNLANNAVKFTERGSVKIHVESTPDAVTVAVIDTGIGIKAESLENLFQAFRQVDGSARRVYEGTGLGLYLCRQLTTLLGGSIEAQSEFGAGSCFRFTLPREPHPPT